MELLICFSKYRLRTFAFFLLFYHLERFLLSILEHFDLDFQIYFILRLALNFLVEQVLADCLKILLSFLRKSFLGIDLVMLPTFIFLANLTMAYLQFGFAKRFFELHHRGNCPKICLVGRILCGMLDQALNLDLILNFASLSN